jgi:KGK domain
LEIIMNDRFESLESGEVISVQHDTLVLSGHRTFRVGELNEAIASHLKQAISNWSEENNGWFTPEGLECEALRFGSKGWQKGRIRLCLEFCPDESNLPAQGTTSSNASTGAPLATPLLGQTIPQPPPPHLPATNSDFDRDHTVNVNTTPVESVTTPDPLSVAIPLAGIAAIGTVAVAATAAVASPDLHPPAVSEPIVPHLVDTTLELEEHHPDGSPSHSGSLDEIAFDFDLADKDRGIASPNGMMELDLTDLSLDFSEHDLLGFEHNGMSDGMMDDSIDLHDLGNGENSGMLIDEVWNELNQGNWTGIN